MNHLGFLKAFAGSGGEWVIYLLIAASVWSVAVIIERFWVITRQRRLAEAWEKKFVEILRASSRKEALARLQPHTVDSGSAASRMAKELLDQGSHGSLSRDQQIEVRLGIEKRYLEKRLLILGTLGNNAPFVGLLGTVLGVIRAFHDLASTAGGPEIVMQGLSEALIATAVGIVVAIPCVASYNYLRKRTKDLLSDLDHLGKRVIALVEGSGE